MCDSRVTGLTSPSPWQYYMIIYITQIYSIITYMIIALKDEYLEYIVIHMVQCHYHFIIVSRSLILNKGMIQAQSLSVTRQPRYSC